jgi:hypothetical protein
VPVGTRAPWRGGAFGVGPRGLEGRVPGRDGAGRLGPIGISHSEAREGEEDGGRERQREGDRQTERGRQTERERERDTDRERERGERERETQSQREAGGSGSLGRVIVLRPGRWLLIVLMSTRWPIRDERQILGLSGSRAQASSST